MIHPLSPPPSKALGSLPECFSCTATYWGPRSPWESATILPTTSCPYLDYHWDLTVLSAISQIHLLIPFLWPPLWIHDNPFTPNYFNSLLLSFTLTHYYCVKVQSCHLFITLPGLPKAFTIKHKQQNLSASPCLPWSYRSIPCHISPLPTLQPLFSGLCSYPTCALTTSEASLLPQLISSSGKSSHIRSGVWHPPCSLRLHLFRFYMRTRALSGPHLNPWGLVHSRDLTSIGWINGQRRKVVAWEKGLNWENSSFQERSWIFPETHTWPRVLPHPPPGLR